MTEANGVLLQVSVSPGKEGRKQTRTHCKDFCWLSRCITSLHWGTLFTFPLSSEPVRILHGKRVSLFSGTSTYHTNYFGLHYIVLWWFSILSKYLNRPLTKPYKHPNETGKVLFCYHINKGTERSVLLTVHLNHLQNICDSVSGLFGFPKHNFKMQSVPTALSSTGAEIIPLSWKSCWRSFSLGPQEVNPRKIGGSWTCFPELLAYKIKHLLATLTVNLINSTERNAMFEHLNHIPACSITTYAC